VQEALKSATASARHQAKEKSTAVQVVIGTIILPIIESD
jgi:uncharacterized protein YggE